MISFLFFSFVSGKLVTEKPSADVNSILVKFNTTEKLNVVGMDHPYVCANFDWWPDTKCDYGNCSWVGNGVNKIDFENKILIQVIYSFLNWIIFSFQAATALSQNLHGLLRIGGSLQDSVTYDFESKEEHCGDFLEVADPSKLEDWGKGCITKLKRRQLMEFGKKTNMKIIFGLNVKVGKTENNHNYTGKYSKCRVLNRLVTKVTEL